MKFLLFFFSLIDNQLTSEYLGKGRFPLLDYPFLGQTFRVGTSFITEDVAHLYCLSCNVADLDYYVSCALEANEWIIRQVTCVNSFASSFFPL